MINHRSENEIAKFKGRMIAHRGLHTKDKSIPENSLAAFRRAAEAGYGIELDVQVSKDGRVMVFHDDNLKRVCGRDALIWTLTAEELRKEKLCGTDETIPFFSEVLDAIGENAGPLVVELKGGPRNTELCEKTYALLKSFKGVYCIESFDPTIVDWFRIHAPEVFRGQLAMPWKSYRGESTALRGLLLSRCLFTSRNRPDFIAYDLNKGERPLTVRRFYKKGILDIAWTSRTPEDLKKGHDSLIFEFYTPDTTY